MKRNKNILSSTYNCIISKGEAQMIKKPQADNITLNDYMNNWLKTYKASRIQATSYDRLERVFTKHISRSCIGDMILTTITKADTQNFFDKKKTELSQPSLKKVYDILNECFRFAITEGHINQNPVAGLNFHNQIVSLKATKKVEPYSVDDLKKLLLEVDYSFKHFRRYLYSPIWVVVMYTDISLGEVLALTWDKVDLDNKSILIDRTITSHKNRNEIGNTRSITVSTKASRSVSLNDASVSALKEIRRRYAASDISSNYVICTEAGTHQTLRAIQDAFESFCKSAKVECKGPGILHSSYLLLNS